MYVKKKSSSSPHTSRDDAHLGSDEEEEDVDDEEDIDKCDEGTGGKEEQVVDVESQLAPAQEDSIGQGSQEGQEICKADGEGKTKNVYQNNKDKMEQKSEENNNMMIKAGNENSEAISVNSNQERDASNTRNTTDQKMAATVEEAEQNSLSEPMETTHPCEAARGVESG